MFDLKIVLSLGSVESRKEDYDYHGDDQRADNNTCDSAALPAGLLVVQILEELPSLHSRRLRRLLSVHDEVFYLRDVD